MKRNWIRNATFDLGFIFAPLFLPFLFLLIFPEYFENNHEINAWNWLILVVLVDVAHVYSTLFKTYFSPVERPLFPLLLILAPLLAFTISGLIYIGSTHLFWRCMAYLAVFHFVRQQYGFFRIYSRIEIQSRAYRHLASAAIYSATLYPLFYWHLFGRDFAWFVQGDFIRLPGSWHLPGLILFLLIQIGYVCVEIFRTIQKTSPVSLTKNLWWLGTLGTWYTGIVWLDGDLSFTLTNVLAHGIPYMALVWHTQQQKIHPVYYVGLIALFALAEELFWDRLLWKDGQHAVLFQWFPAVGELSPETAALTIALLSTPQITHYILDGYIWKKGRTNFP